MQSMYARQKITLSQNCGVDLPGKSDFVQLHKHVFETLGEALGPVTLRLLSKCEMLGFETCSCHVFNHFTLSNTWNSLPN